MARLTAKLLHQCPAFSASRGKVFVAGGICHVIMSTNIRVIRLVNHRRGNVTETCGGESITLRAMQGGSINWTSVRGRSIYFVPYDWLS